MIALEISRDDALLLRRHMERDMRWTSWGQRAIDKLDEALERDRVVQNAKRRLTRYQ